MTQLFPFTSFPFRLSAVASIVLLGLNPTSTMAGAFSLFGEANGRNAGDFAAGAAADAEDASTLFYNPAGLVHLKGKQLVLGGTIVKAKSTLSDDAYLSLTTSGFSGSSVFSINGLDSTQTAVIPSFFYSKNVSNKLTWGVGVYAPFGLSTNWAESSNARYSATLSKLEVINVAPALGVKINRKLSFGAALDIQLGTVDFNSVGGVSTSTISDSISTNHGTSVGFGGHIGLMYQPTVSTRLGLNYQSAIMHQFYGKSTLVGMLADPNLTDPSYVSSTDSLFSDPISMPAQITLSAMHQLTEKLTLGSTVAFTQWSVFESIGLNNVIGQEGIPMDKPIIVSENFRNTWRIAGGMKYQWTDKIKLRMGLGYDQSPANNVDRNLRLPDSDRIALAAGVHYQATSTVGFDLGWTHLFIKDTRIDNTASFGDNVIYVNGGVKSNVDLIGGQMTWKIS